MLTLNSLIGICIGILVALALPSFLYQSLEDASVLMLPIPTDVVFFTIAVCLSASTPFWIDKSIKQNPYRAIGDDF